MDDMDVKHITNLPHNHQLNCLAEKYVQLVKILLYKAKESGEDPYFTLMLYRNTLFVMVCHAIWNSCVADKQDLTCQ